MRSLKHFLRFWYDFLVGDDWMIAAGVVMALILSMGLAHQDLHAWWMMPVAVGAMLTVSLWRETRRWPERCSTSASNTPGVRPPLPQTRVG